MRSYVLIPGLWAGAWIWQQIERQLRAAGHHTLAVTLSGLSPSDADRKNITLADHVDDVLSVLIEEGLNDVILVAHDYGGIVAGSVVDRAPERVAHTVYVEAFVAHDGKSMLDVFPDSLRAEELRLIDDNDGRLPPPPVAAISAGQDLSHRDAQWLLDRFVGHPCRSISDPVTLTRPPATHSATYVVCEKDHFTGSIDDDIGRLRDEPGWTFRTLKTGRWPMLSAPGELSELLLEVDRRVGAPSAGTAAFD
ncbi:alpha/beta hydrolase [Streptosporangium sp. NBC_01639]|nr:alpha/beta hydrolase [Streptosporangium sp. NBC_01756]WTD56004.1 alpha/beta hydrolase [Streptosporangium sp. NBC_01639]